MIPPSRQKARMAGSSHVADVKVIGAGPAGLMAAEILGEAGHRVTIHDHMAAPARKFLLAGRGGLNLTHSEPLDAFLERYGEAQALPRARHPRLPARSAHPMGQWPRHRNLRRHLGPRLPEADEGLAPAPRLAAPARWAGRQARPPLALGRLRRHAHHPRTRRRQLAAAGFGCRMASDLRGEGHHRSSLQARQQPLPRPLVAGVPARSSPAPRSRTSPSPMPESACAAS